MRVSAVVAYDGTDFHGFQRQANARSVQGVLEFAIGRICGQTTAVIGAGRTDAGVHATGQVIAFDATWRHSVAELQRALNSELPDDVAVSEIAECDERFHPRYSAVSRVYEYRVAICPTRQPVLRLYHWQIGRPLNVEAMNEASQSLVGEHDFAAFGSAPKGDVTVRRVLRAGWTGDERLLLFTIEANAFLFRMVRRIVFTLVRLGSGQLAADDVAGLLAARDPQQVKGAAPACGLCLVKVNY